MRMQEQLPHKGDTIAQVEKVELQKEGGGSSGSKQQEDPSASDTRLDTTNMSIK